MEPQEPAKDDESSGLRQRRISSILKAPRKSARFPDPDQQENAVECPKPVEKRNSRRVSFALANNVLLFSSDAKNASPVRNPLQELITTTSTTQSSTRVHVGATESAIQQIMGMETLLSAPLHASERNKVNFITGENFGEKTVIFSAEDEFMDMTHSHSVNIGVSDVENRVAEGVCQQMPDVTTLKNPFLHASHPRHKVNFDLKDECREKTMFTADDKFMDMIPSHTVNIASGPMPSQPVLIDSLDPEFEKFLSRLSKPSGSSGNLVMTKTVPPPIAASSREAINADSSLSQPKIASSHVDKENHLLNTNRSFGQLFTGSTVCPEDDVSMEMTQAYSGLTGSDDPFQFLLPTQEVYPRNENLKKEGVTLEKKNSEPLMSSNHKGTETLVKPSLPVKVQRHQTKFDTEDDYRDKTVRLYADDASMDFTQTHTANTATELKWQSHQNFDFVATCGDKTVRLTANDASMNMTQCLTVNIDQNLIADSVLPLKKQEGEKCHPPRMISSSAHDLGTEDEVSMDMTEAHTGHIFERTATDNPLTFLPTQDMYLQGGNLEKAKMASRQQSNEGLGSSTCKGLETTLKTSFKAKMLKQQVTFDSEDHCPEKTVRFSAEDACMELTRGHTVNIATAFEPQLHQNLEFASIYGEKTVKFTANDATMDVTKSHTVNIATAFEPESHQNLDFLSTCGETTVRFSAEDACMEVTRDDTVNISTAFEPESHRNLEFASTCGEKTVKFTGSDATMDVTKSHTVNIATAFEPKSQQNLESLSTYGDKTVRLSAEDACMEVTRGVTVNISTAFEPESHRNLEFASTCGEKTVKFTASDATMDVTKSHTVNIATAFEPESHQNLDFLSTCGEKTVRFSAEDACMEVTRGDTVNIATHLKPESHQNLEFLSTCGEKTVRITGSDATMDVTKSHTVNIATAFEPQSHQNMDLLPTCGDKTVKFTANEASMDMSKNLAVNIKSSLLPDAVAPQQHSKIISTSRNMDLPVSVKKIERGLRRNRFSSAQSLDPGFKNSLFRTSGPWANPVITKAVAPAASSPQDDVDTNGCSDQLKMQKPHVKTDNEAPDFDPCSNPLNKTEAHCIKDDISMNLVKAQTGHVLGQACTDERPPCLSPRQDLYTKSMHNDTLGSSNPDGVEITTGPDCFDSNEAQSKKELEQKHQSSPLLQKMQDGVDKDADVLSSQMSRRKSLADLQTKLRRFSHIVNSAPDTVHSCTMPLPQLDRGLDKNSKSKIKSLPVVEPELKTGLVNVEDNTQGQCLTEGEQASTTASTPFNLKTKQLMSRLSMGGFKPKLPQRTKPDDPSKANQVKEHKRTTCKVTTQLNNFDNDVSDIYDEELGSYEDVTETLDTVSPKKICEKVSDSMDFDMDESLENVFFDEDFISDVHGQKRCLPEDEHNVKDEKRMKPSTEMTNNTVEIDLKSCVVECDGTIATAPSMTPQVTDCSSSIHTAGTRGEAAGCMTTQITDYSSSKQSLFESQLEDCGNDVQKKLDDGTITVSEFFKLFNIDFVIHNSRHSVLPGRLLSDTDRTPMDLLRDRHINHPKQMVYATDVRNLTEKVEGLKVRMCDLDKPLKNVNRPLWEEMRSASEKELVLFGAELKERNNFFRKMSKILSHKIKEDLYSTLVQANVEEQQKLRGTIERADEMVKSLDDCIHELETELASLSEKGFEGKPSLKSRQEELEKVTEALADSERQISELEMEKQQNSKKLNRLKAETRNLESHITMLHMMSEYKFGEKKDNGTTYTFLYDTLHLQLVYENSKGNDAGNGSEQKISHITFQFQLDDKRSKPHAGLVHKLLSKYTEEESDWVGKYSTGRHVPKLLHDVGLVVSRCRLLGEELRLLKMWGGLRLNILDLSCLDTQVHIVFSSLKAFSKFEVVFSVSLLNQLYVIQVQSFKNRIGNTTMEQIEKIVASFNPGKNLLTKIITKINGNLLC
ncbi:uncharacterized protein knl1 [Mastacembelus armatus]|uniref:Kinetochore scaffold 1 n=1 Tax=Mastacembelus armatus TaxID=205130 RepID=A0A3Q3KMZ6_9TELE|nr:kinetochore scaffold 1 [Mastacembelus armatus]